MAAFALWLRLDNRGVLDPLFLQVGHHLLATGKSPLGKKLDALEAKGMVERQSDEKDRRVKRIYMTNKLEPLEEELREVVDNMVLLAAEGISNPDLDQIRTWLRVMISNLTTALNDGLKKMADTP